MYLIAESGSTKTDWIEFGNKGITNRFRTSGVNPDVQTRDYIEQLVRTELAPQLEFSKVKSLYFYGAGLRSPKNKKIIKKILSEILPETELKVFHDLLASARACCGNEKGISCILGTGSNSCLYDGKKIIDQKGGHGYLFGDEGSGSNFGKKLVRASLNKELSPGAENGFVEWIGMSSLDFRKEIHQSSKPNVVLAGLSRFIYQNLNYPELEKIVMDSFREFLQSSVLLYSDYQRYPVYFVGSIAFLYKDQLEKVCSEFDIKAQKLIRSPIDELVGFHIQSL